MKQAIENFCRKRDKGLFLLDMPTGFGKTYSVLDFIADFYDLPQFANTKFFFLTTLKKNLPDENLREHFVNRGKGSDYDNLCLRLNANYESVIEKLTTVNIPKEIKNKTEYKSLYSMVRLIKQYEVQSDKGKYKNSFVELYHNAVDSVREELEPAFRKNVIAPLLNKFKTPMERLKMIQNESEYMWIGEIYPAVYTNQKKIFFMSMDKFILGNTTLIEPTYNFYNNKIIDNSIIFIDEFDSTRDTMLNQIIKKGLNNNIDYLTLFAQIHSALSTREFPAMLTTDSAYVKANPGYKNCQDILDSFSVIFNNTFDKYNMKYSFRTEDYSNSDNGRNFIFSDSRFHSVLSGDNSFVQLTVDKKAKQNWLKFMKKRPAEQDSDILGLLSDVKGCISYYQNGCRLLAMNYQQLKNEHKKEYADDFTTENAIVSVLREFRLSKEYQNYLTPFIMSGHINSKIDKRGSNNKLSLRYFDKSIYEKGFRYYDFINDANHDMQSEIMLYDFQDSPEKIILKMASKARVVGISATATLDTVLGNYSIDYFKTILQEDYYVPDNQDINRMNADFENYIKNYDKININVTALACNNQDIFNEMKSIFSNNALAKKYTEILEMKFSGDNKFAVNTFIKIIKALKAFILNNEVRAFLCLTNKLAHENKPVYDIKLLIQFADEIIRENNITYLQGKNLIYSLTGEEYDLNYKNMVNRLSQGEKLFVVSSYGTVGAGQNLQYSAPKDIPLVEVNEYSHGDRKKDFDCLFLEKPTNLIVNIAPNKSLEAENLIRFIFQMEFLMDRGEISRSEGIECIKSAFMCYSGNLRYSKKKNTPYKTISANNYAIRVLIQAVGRICRTGLKNKDIYIYVDEDIFNNYDLSVVEDRMLNPEFRKIIEFGKQYKIKNKNIYDKKSILENAASMLSLNAMSTINDMMKFHSSDDTEYWKKIRALLLMHPTISIEEFERNSQYGFIYAQAHEDINSYSYEQERDFNKNIIVKFDDSLAMKVSENEVHLQEVLEIPGLREFFIRNKYATSFQKNRYILTPPMFNNIYKGALGEVAGKFILENFLNVKLYDMPLEYFEKFDFSLKNGVYIDFKYWKDTDEVNADEQKKEILDKLQYCNGVRVLIINVVSTCANTIISSADGKIIEVSGLYRLDKKEIDNEILMNIAKEGYLIEENIHK